MMENDQHALAQLTAAGYFRHMPDGLPNAAILDDIARRGLELALFDHAPDTARCVPLDAEDLADGGAGMGIQQVKILFARRGIALDAADSDTYDKQADLTYLTINDTPATLCKWSWGPVPDTDSVRDLTSEAALQDLLWKFKAQGVKLYVTRCENIEPASADMFIAWEDESRFLHRWSFGTDDGWMLYSVGFFSIVNRLLADAGSAERMYAHRPFTNEQRGILLSSELYATLGQLNLTQHLRRIDSLQY